MKDLTSSDPAAKAEVAVWMRSPDFEYVCDMADVQPMSMADQMRRLVAMPPSLAKKYGEQLRELIVGTDY